MSADDEWLAALADRLEREWTKNYLERGCGAAQKRHIHVRENMPYETDEYLRTHNDLQLKQHMGVTRQYLSPFWVPLCEEVKMWLNSINSIHRPTYEEQMEKPELIGTGILFWGPSGTGKTVAAVDLLTKMVRLGIKNTDPDLNNISWHGKSMGRFYSWQEVSELFRRAASGEDGTAVEWLEKFDAAVRGGGDPMYRADFLLLDDISRERQTEFNSGELHRILRYRCERGWTTILTTNHTPKDWQRVYGDVLAAYLTRSFMAVELDHEWRNEYAG